MQGRQQRNAQTLQSHREDTCARKRVCVWRFARMQERRGSVAARRAHIETTHVRAKESVFDIAHRKQERRGSTAAQGTDASVTSRRHTCAKKGLCLALRANAGAHRTGSSAMRRCLNTSRLHTCAQSAQTGLCLANGWLDAPPRLPHIRVRPVRI